MSYPMAGQLSGAMLTLSLRRETAARDPVADKYSPNAKIFSGSMLLPWSPPTLSRLCSSGSPIPMA